VVTPRLWLVFWSEPADPAWWARVLRPGFRHVYAVSYFADQQRWVYFDPSRFRTSIELFSEEQAPEALARLMAPATAILRVASRADRLNAPTFPWCVGQIKALLGIRSRACTPHALYRDLLARGAEVVRPEVPCVAAGEEATASSAP
jgi:hypothetical protein